MQRIAPLVPVNDELKLRRKDRLDKSARVNIHNNCLLPVLSDGSTKIPCYPLSNVLAHVVLLQRPMLCIRREKFHARRRRPIWSRQMQMTRNRTGTYMIEHLVDSLDHMRALVPRLPAAPPAAVCEKRTLLFSGSDFPVTSISIPVIR
jgi:hypothetical protein